MESWTEKLTSYAPPLWLTASVAAVVAAMILTAFVDTLREHLRQGDQLRQAQVAAAEKRPAIAAVADTTHARTEQLRLR